jgi:cytoskeletal protein RodZ
MTVGAYLREARESAGFSLEEIAERTRIPRTIVKDLEAERFDSSGGTAYARGHIRAIAKLVNTDIDRLMSAFDETIEVNTTPMIELLDANNATSIRSRQNIKLQPRQVMVVASIIAGLAIAIPSSIAISHSLAHKSSTAPKIATKSAKTTSAPVQQQSPVTTAAIPAHTVSITASQGTSWLSVTDTSGALLFSGKLSNGASQSFDPANGLYMKIGNAGAVSVSVDGKDQGSIGVTGEVKSLTFAPAQTNG